jgi:hypothetical protein
MSLVKSFVSQKKENEAGFEPMPSSLNPQRYTLWETLVIFIVNYNMLKFSK